MGFILQWVAGVISNWGIAPFLLLALPEALGYVAIYALNLGRIWIVVFAYDKTRDAIAFATEERGKENIVVVIREYFLGAVFTLGNSFYGVLYIRRGHTGFPKKFWGRIAFAILISTIGLVLALKGIFSFFGFVKDLIEENIHIIAPYLIR